MGGGVEIRYGALKAVAPKPRDRVQELLAEEPLGAPQAVTEREGVVEPNAQVDLPQSVWVALVDGVDEAHRSHQSRSGVEEAPALDQPLTHQRKVEIRQVAQTSVDQSRGTAGGAEGEVSLLHQRGLETP